MKMVERKNTMVVFWLAGSGGAVAAQTATSINQTHVFAALQGYTSSD